MAVTSELTVLRRTVDQLRDALAAVRGRYGDVPAVRRLLNDLERIELDASELDDLSPVPAPPTAQASEMLILDDTPVDPSLWEGADDEGLGGYHR